MGSKASKPNVEKSCETGNAAGNRKCTAKEKAESKIKPKPVQETVKDVEETGDRYLANIKHKIRIAPPRRLPQRATAITTAASAVVQDAQVAQVAEAASVSDDKKLSKLSPSTSVSTPLCATVSPTDTKRQVNKVSTSTLESSTSHAVSDETNANHEQNGRPEVIFRQVSGQCVRRSETPIDKVPEGNHSKSATPSSPPIDSKNEKLLKDGRNSGPCSSSPANSRECKSVLDCIASNTSCDSPSFIKSKRTESCNSNHATDDFDRAALAAELKSSFSAKASPAANLRKTEEKSAD